MHIQRDGVGLAHADAFAPESQSLPIRTAASPRADFSAGADNAMPGQRFRQGRLRQESTDEPGVSRPADRRRQSSVGADAALRNGRNQPTEPQDGGMGARDVVDLQRRGRFAPRSPANPQFGSRTPTSIGLLSRWLRRSLRHDQSALTGVSGGLPLRTATTFSAAISAMRFRVATVADPICGRSTTLSSSSSSFGIAGSPS